jgi:uncharacterized protein (TIGR00661 family)
MANVLITPLDWGLGHATRCIPIINELLKRQCTVLIAGNGDSLALLKNEFPDLLFLQLPGYRPVYSSKKILIWKLVLQVPKFIRAIRQEHRQVGAIIRQHNVDIIISDNRYGCWSKETVSILITHQLNIIVPRGFGWLNGMVRAYNYKLIKRFSWCWVPDYADPEKSLSGILSQHNKKSLANVRHIGPLSRLTKAGHCEAKYDVVCVFSGPEPQRSIFENIVIPQLKTSGLRYFVVRGIFNGENFLSSNEAVSLDSKSLQSIISESSIVIARSGYSTIMDLAALGKKAIMVPTPGQTEQEYLARRWSQKGILYATTQESFSLQKSLNESSSYPGFSAAIDDATKLLGQALDELIHEHVADTSPKKSSTADDK